MSKTDRRLTSLFSKIIGNQDFFDWCDFQAYQLVKETNQKPSLVSLVDLFKSRRIVSITYEDLDISGKIIPTRGGFHLIISDKIKAKSSELRFTMAHELAHTFFFDLGSETPEDLSQLPQGNEHLEFACDYLALSLLMPKNWIMEHLNNFQMRDVQSRNYMTFLYSTSQKFGVSLHLTLTRLAQFDSDFERGILLTFKKENSESGIWKLSTRHIHWFFPEKESLAIGSESGTNYPAEGIIYELLTKLHSKYAGKRKDGYNQISVQELVMSGDFAAHILRKALPNGRTGSIGVYYMYHGISKSSAQVSLFLKLPTDTQ